MAEILFPRSPLMARTRAHRQERNQFNPAPHQLHIERYAPPGAFFTAFLLQKMGGKTLIRDYSADWLVRELDT